MKTKSLMLVAALAAGLMSFTAEAARVWDVVGGGGFGTGSTWSSQLTSAYSVGVWVKGITAQYYVYLVNLHGVTSLGFLNNDDQLYFSTTQSDAVGGTNVSVKVTCPLSVFRRRNGEASVPKANDDNWHFIVGTFNYDSTDASKCFQRLYVDGALVGETSVAYGNLIAGKRKLCFGGANDGGPDSSYWMNWGLQSGRYADVTLWNRGITLAEVSALYQHRAGGGESGLVGYWPLDTPTISCANQAKGGISSSMGSVGGGTKTVVEDPDFFDNCRYVASPQWVAANHYVQSANATFRTWDDPATNIQDAVDVARIYEQVRVMPGTYTLTQQIAVTNANRTVTSCDPETGKPDRANTVIDCNNACRGFKIGKGEKDYNIEVRGFTVKNGSVPEGSGGGVLVSGHASALSKLSLKCRLVDCTVTNCTARQGGGIELFAGLVTNCLVTGCTASRFCGGISISRGVQYSNVRANEHEVGTVSDCDIIGNMAVGTYDAAGTGCAGGIGPASDCHWYTFIVRNTRFRNNRLKTSFSSTRSRRGGHLDVGAGSWIEGCTFSGDCAAGYGSCMDMGSGQDNGVPPTITNCFFVGATSGDGFGYLHPSKNAKILNCIVTNNAYTSAFVFNEGGSGIVIRQCLFADNTQSSVVQGHNSGATYVENCTVAMTGAMKATSASTSKDIFVNCILGGTVTSTSSHQAIVSNCVVKALGGTPNPANWNAWVGRAPGFKDAAHGDYTLRPGAFARDKGEMLGWMANSTDLARNPRLVNREGVAYAEDALPDLGCYEQQERAPGMMLLVR